MAIAVREKGRGNGPTMDLCRPMTDRTPRDLIVLVGLAAVFFSAIYFVSDAIEFAQGGFSTPQLVLTYVGEAAIPLFVIGLYAAQRPEMGRLGLVGAVGYAYAFIFFTGTVSFALANTHGTGMPSSIGWVPGSPSTAH